MSAQSYVTADDIGRLPKKQQDALGDLCIGKDYGHPRATYKALVKKGLLQEVQIEEPTRYGVFRMTRYELATWGVHIAWCEWCATQPFDDEPGEPTP